MIKGKVFSYVMKLIYTTCLTISTYLLFQISRLTDKKNGLIYQENKVFLFRNNKPGIGTCYFEIINFDFF